MTTETADEAPGSGASRRGRDVVAGVFVFVAAAAMAGWAMLELRAAGRLVLDDPQVAPAAVALALAVPGLLLSWTRFGRGIMLVVGLAVASQAVAAVVLALGVVGVTGRPGAPAALHPLPIVAALAGIVGVGVATLASRVRRTLGRRQLVGTTVATVLGLVAVGMPRLSVYPVGDPASITSRAAPFVVNLVGAVLVALLATAALRTSRWEALGQAGAAMALLGSQTWAAWLVDAPAAFTTPIVVGVLVAATLVVVVAAAGARANDPAHLGPSVPSRPPPPTDVERVARGRDPDPTPILGDDLPPPPPSRDRTDVLPPVEDRRGPDDTEVVETVDPTLVIEDDPDHT